MRTAIFRYLSIVFVIALCSCMMLGALLTITQLVGTILLMPDLVVRVAEWLTRPVMASAAAFALLSFFATYFRPSPEPDTPELD